MDQQAVGWFCVWMRAHVWGDVVLHVGRSSGTCQPGTNFGQQPKHNRFFAAGTPASSHRSRLSCQS